MSYKLLFVLNAVVVLIVGVAFLAVPDLILKQFQVDSYESTLLLGRFFGTAMIALGLVLWFAKNLEDAALQKGLAVALLISATLGLVVNIIGTASGIMRANGWITMIIYVLFILAYAFMLFLKPKMKE